MTSRYRTQLQFIDRSFDALSVPSLLLIPPSFSTP